jgi:hypothetical protein
MFSTFAPARRLGVRMEESWLKSKAESMVGGTSGSIGSDPRVMFPESWSSNLTLAANQAVLAHRLGKSRLDNAFVLIEGHPVPIEKLGPLWQFLLSN